MDLASQQHLASKIATFGLAQLLCGSIWSGHGSCFTLVVSDRTMTRSPQLLHGFVESYTGLLGKTLPS